MSSNMTIIIFAVAVAISLFMFGQWLNADTVSTAHGRLACETQGTC